MGNLEFIGGRGCNPHCLIEIYVRDRIILKLIFILLYENGMVAIYLQHITRSPKSENEI